MKIRGGFAIFLSALIVLAFIGCGGGGSDSSSSVNSTAAIDESGTVALMLTDGPADTYDHIWIKVRRALLLTEDGSAQIVIFNPAEPATYDLLDLRPDSDSDAGELLSMTEVPAGMYAKIRLEVDSVKGETILPDGGSEITVFKLSSKKIDLNPRGEFYVAPDTTIAVTLDIDCDKSIHVSGNNKNFRPVVFVNILPVDQSPLCPRFLQGTISALSFAPDQTTLTALELTLASSGMPISLYVDEHTSIIDDSGIPVESLALGDPVVVRASLQEEGLVASLIIVGDLAPYTGVVVQPVENNEFPLKIDTDASVDSQIIELIPDTTLILWGCDQEVGPEMIQSGMRARVIGTPQEDGSVRALVVLLSPRYISGLLESMSATDGGYQLEINTAAENAPPAYASVFLPSGAPIKVKFDGALSADGLMALVACNPRPVMVTVDGDDSTGLTANGVTVLPETQWTTVIDLDAPEGLILTAAGWISVDDQARVFDLTLSGTTADSISDIQAGDLLLLYGLSQCPEHQSVFDAYVVLILPPQTTTAE